MKDPSLVRVSGPLEAFSAGFAAELLRLGYTRDSAGQQMHLTAHLSRWMHTEGLKAQDLSAAEVERFLCKRRAVGYTSRLSMRGVDPLLTYLRRLGIVSVPRVVVPQGPAEAVLERYRHRIVEQRGVRWRTARRYADTVRPFLRPLVPPGGADPDLGRLDAAEVRAYVVARCPGLSSNEAKLTVTALRSFLGFAHLEGLIDRPLVAAVPSVAGWRLAGLPKGLEAVDRRSLLSSCDRRTRRGRRDFAILTVLVRLGLRAGEVASLRLEDIDWRAGTLVTHGKANRVDILPLPAEVGEAIAAYLHRGRPAGQEDRAVFLRVNAPLRTLTSDGVRQVVASAARRAGLEGIHAHRLRHTAATDMVRAGASLTEVGQVLRHRRPMTTAIYAKVDRDALRTIARRWPEVTP